MSRRICISLLLFLVSLLMIFSTISQTALALTQNDVKSIRPNTNLPFYDPSSEGCSGTSNPTTGAAGGKVFLIGDSVAAGAGSSLDNAFKSQGFTSPVIDAVANRTLTEGGQPTNGLTVLQNSKASFADASVVVVELGTNSGGLNSDNIKKAVDTIKSAAPSAEIFWVNVGVDNGKRNGTPLDNASLNKIITDNKSLGYSVIDWASAVQQHPEYIDPNPLTGLGVHLSEAGKPAFSNTIAAGASSSSPSENNSDPQCICPTGGGNLPGNDNPEKIWNFLINKGLPAVAVAAVMGNIQKESGFRPNLVQYGGINSRGEKSAVNSPTSLDDNMRIDGSTGYGLVQWTSLNRQQNLHNFAVSRGTIDGDLNTQLEFLYMEAGGVWQKLSTFTDVSAATLYFHDAYEGSGDDAAKLALRVQFATDILARYGGSAPSTTPSDASNSGNCGGQNGASNSSIAKTAIDLAWKDGSHGREAKPEYIAAAAGVYPNASTDKLTNCSAFVAVVMRTSGADSTFPTGCSRDQANYAAAHPDKYEIIPSVQDEGQLKPGDILVVGGCDTSGHIYIWIGPQDDPSIPKGFNKADASQGSRMPNLGKAGSFTERRGTYMAIRFKG